MSNKQNDELNEMIEESGEVSTEGLNEATKAFDDDKNKIIEAYDMEKSDLTDNELLFRALKEDLQNAKLWLNTAEIAKAICETLDYEEVKTLTVDLMSEVENVRSIKYDIM